MANRATRFITLIASFDEHPKVQLITSEIIKQIYEETNANVVVLLNVLDNEFNQILFAYRGKRGVVIYGRNGTDGLFEALRRIVEDYFMSGAKPRDDGSYVIKFLADKLQCINLLGKIGSTLRGIEYRSDCRIRMSAATPALVEVRSATVQALLAAVEQIAIHLAISPVDHRVINPSFGPLLPNDVFRNMILLKLSVNDLIRYKIVSKEWKFEITSQDFVEEHFRNNNSETRVILSRNRAVLSRFFDLDYLEDQQTNDGIWTLSLLPSINLPAINWQMCVVSGDGLVCIFMTDASTHPAPGVLMLWNPCTGQHRCHRVSGFIIYDEHNLGLHRGVFEEEGGYCGCCYSFVDHDFKVVHLTCGPPGYKYKYRGCGSFDYCTLDIFNIYAHTLRRFRLMLDDDFIQKKSIFRKCGVHMNGAIHWLEIVPGQNGNYKGRVLSLNVEEIVFQDLIILPDYDIDMYWPLHLGVLDGKLSFVLKCEIEGGFFGSQVWLMNEYGNQASWVSYSVTITYPASLFADMMPLCISRNGGMLGLLELLVDDSYVREYALFDSDGDIVWGHEYDTDEFKVPPLGFIESLFSP